MHITWTNCADVMPPDKCTTKVMVRKTDDIKFWFVQSANIVNSIKQVSEWEWTPYTPEKWKELNK